MAALKVMKKELRQKVKATLSSLSTEDIKTQSSLLSPFFRLTRWLIGMVADIAVNKLLSMPEYQRARRISIYLSMPTGEISTSPIVHDALKQGKQVFVPYTYKAPKREDQPTSIMDMLQLHSLSDFGSFNPDKWGIPTPSEFSIPERRNTFGSLGLSNGAISGEDNQCGLDFIVVPGMAFDANFGRLGHGKGFYDYFLSRCLKQSQSSQGVKMPYLGKSLVSFKERPDNVHYGCYLLTRACTHSRMSPFSSSES